MSSKSGSEVDTQEGGNAVYLLALQDEIDRLREVPVAAGVPGLLLFLALLTVLFTSADLGVLWTFLAACVVGSPGLVLVAKDLRLIRRIRVLEQQLRIEEAAVAAEGPAEDGAARAPQIEL